MADPQTRVPKVSSRSAKRDELRGQIGISVIIAINTLIEATLLAADLGLIGSPYWRSLVYGNFAFHAPLLHGQTANYVFQPVTMFFTYAFLHGGWLHLAVNMIALASFGPGIIRQAGTARFLLGYFASGAGGALLFGLLSDSVAPMVGASGALFGLLGIWICWGYLERRHYGEGMREIYRALAILVGYNLVFWVLLGGHLAWETHLGGFLTGWAIALVWGRPIYRRQRRNRGQ